ncbi:MAG: sensor histidine kinase [Rhodoglobus sp.]|nr:sensor histidine kinase [Rhodoglobus sp.]
MFRRLSPVQLAVDVSIAVVCLLVRTAIGYDGLAMWVVVFLMASALAIRRLSPAVALGVAWAGVFVQLVALLNPDASNLAILAVLYTTSRYGGTTTKWLGLASAGVGSVLAAAYMLAKGFFVTGFLFSPTSPGEVVKLTQYFVAGLFAALAVLGLSWTLGLLAKTWATARQSRRDQVRAERAVVVEQERNRIARDMHDVVAHSLAVVIAQADGAKYARANDPEAVGEALTTISTTAREALADVRLLLGQLRHNQEAGPQPVLADLTRLFDQLRASGLIVMVETSGRPATLPSSRQLAVYRIVQEALTNALRHGDTAQPAVVRLDWGEDAVELTVSNALAAPAALPEHSGHGIAGMRERALLVGGTFTAEAADGLFIVRAVVPVLEDVLA